MDFSVKGKKFFYACVIASGVLTACVSETPSTGKEQSGVNRSSDLYRMGFYASERNASGVRVSVDEGSMNGRMGRRNLDITYMPHNLILVI